MGSLLLLCSMSGDHSFDKFIQTPGILLLHFRSASEELLQLDHNGDFRVQFDF